VVITTAPPEGDDMKIIHGSLSGLLGEVTAHGPDDGVRVAALMQSTVEGAGMPRYTSWVIEAKAANGKTAWQVATGEEVVRLLREARGRR
jgi:hypothetical protein